jgi:hypothetical protein
MGIEWNPVGSNRLYPCGWDHVNGDKKELIYQITYRELDHVVEGCI